MLTTPGLTPEHLAAAEDAIREFRFYRFGLNDIDPNSDTADWVPELAEAVARAVLDVTNQAAE
jgi:hypothetical protein